MNLHQHLITSLAIVLCLGIVSYSCGGSSQEPCEEAQDNYNKKARNCVGDEWTDADFDCENYAATSCEELDEYFDCWKGGICETSGEYSYWRAPTCNFDGC